MRGYYRLMAILLMLVLSHQASAQQPQSPTLWRFLGIPQGIQKIRDARTNRNGSRPGSERQDPLKRLAAPENLESDNPAIKKAAEVKQAEDKKDQKIKAIKYLAKMGCGCYDKDGSITEALLAATDDCTPDVREATLCAILDTVSGCSCSKCGSTSCCNEKINKRLSQMAYEKDDDGCPIEPNRRIRQIAARVLNRCCPGGPPTGPIEEDVEEETEKDVDDQDAPKDPPKNDDLPTPPPVKGEGTGEDGGVKGEADEAIDDTGDRSSVDAVIDAVEDAVRPDNEPDAFDSNIQLTPATVRRGPYRDTAPPSPHLSSRRRYQHARSVQQVASNSSSIAPGVSRHGGAQRIESRSVSAPNSAQEGSTAEVTAGSIAFITPRSDEILIRGFSTGQLQRGNSLAVYRHKQGDTYVQVAHLVVKESLDGGYTKAIPMLAEMVESIRAGDIVVRKSK